MQAVWHDVAKERDYSSLHFNTAAAAAAIAVTALANFNPLGMLVAYMVGPLDFFFKRHKLLTTQRRPRGAKRDAQCFWFDKSSNCLLLRWSWLAKASSIVLNGTG